jgi:hypothetical protein
MIQTPEPIDWTRLGAGPIRSPDSSATPFAAKLVQNSDFTLALLLRLSGQEIDSTTRYFPYDPGKTYLWDILEYQSLPPHLSWLQGWVDHRAATYTLAFEIPPVK